MGPAFSLFRILFAPSFVAVLIYIHRRFREPLDSDVITVMWVGLLTGAIVYGWLNNLGGKEEFCVDSQELVRRRFFFRWSSVATYKMAGISSPRLIPYYFGYAR